MQVSLPNNTINSLTHTAYLNVPNFSNIPRAVLNTYLFPDRHENVLLSVSQFCDHGYKVIFNRKMCLYLIKINDFKRL